MRELSQLRPAFYSFKEEYRAIAALEDSVKKNPPKQKRERTTVDYTTERVERDGKKNSRSGSHVIGRDSDSNEKIRNLETKLAQREREVASLKKKLSSSLDNDCKLEKASRKRMKNNGASSDSSLDNSLDVLDEMQLEIINGMKLRKLTNKLHHNVS